MRALLLAAAALVVFGPGVASAQITCSQLPAAQRYVEHLRPGPNTSEARRHLEMAEHAGSNGECVAQLRQVDMYAKRSTAADRRARYGHRRRVPCATVLHENRPGGIAYNGPPTSCPKVHLLPHL